MQYPKQIKQYHYKQVIGRGSYGTVVRYYDADTDSSVIAKFFNTNHPSNI